MLQDKDKCGGSTAAVVSINIFVCVCQRQRVGLSPPPFLLLCYMQCFPFNKSQLPTHTSAKRGEINKQTQEHILLHSEV